MIDIAEKYRLKALACEKLAREATEKAIKLSWADIAIEWHALANRAHDEKNSIEATER